MSFTVIPAIDLRAGRVVRLKQGDYARQTTYADDPCTLAKCYADAGAQWIHLVDLDGACSGRLDNLAIAESIARDGVQVQSGGGVRHDADVQRLFDAGVARVVLGSVAINQTGQVKDWLHSYGADRFILALDTRCLDGRWTLPTAGWTQAGQRTLDELAPWYAAQGACHLLCTDIERDGMQTGCNLDLYRHLVHIAPSLRVQASGGMRGLDDIRAVRETGADSLILGRALLEGRFTMAEALAC